MPLNPLVVGITETDLAEDRRAARKASPISPIPPPSPSKKRAAEAQPPKATEIKKALEHSVSLESTDRGTNSRTSGTEGNSLKAIKLGG